MSILSKWGFRAGNCGGSVHASYRYHRYLSRSSKYAPDAVANPRTPDGDFTFLGTLRDEPAAGWQAVKTRWQLVEERLAFESWAVREMTRVHAIAENREEIIENGIRKVREVDE
jgi:hypothetical protein